MVAFLTERGINKDRGFLVPLSTTANFVSLSLPEKKLIAKTFIDAARDQIPVAVGCNSVNQKESIELAQYSQVGAVAILISPPFYWKPTEAQIIDHFRRICESIDIGVIIYNNHWASQIDMPIALIEKLLENKNIIGIKESTHSISKLTHITRKLSGYLNIYNGMGEVYEPMYAQIGCSGFTSTIGNIIPELTASLYDCLVSHQYDKARQVSRLAEPMATYLDSLSGGQYITALLQILNRFGICEEDVRPPMIPLSLGEIERLEILMEKLETASTSIHAMPDSIP